MVNKCVTYLFFVCLCLNINAQIVPDYNKDGSDLNVLYRNEQTFEVYAHTRGYGLSYRRAKHLNGKSKSYFEVDASSLKHPKEIKLNGTDVERKRYVYGKLNSVLLINATVGKQKVIAGKADKKAVEVRYSYSIGPGIALAKPYYYSTVTSETSSVDKYRKFNSSTFTQDSVIGRAPFINGLGELSVYPFVAGKFNLSFEYAPYGNLVKAIETGVSINYFPIGLPIMAHNPAENLIITIHLGFVFGKRWY
jgi:hypothetical protein